MTTLRLLLLIALIWLILCAYNYCFYTRYADKPLDPEKIPEVTLNDAYVDPRLSFVTGMEIIVQIKYGERKL